MPQRLVLWTFVLISTLLLHLHAQEQPPPPPEIEQAPSTPEAVPPTETPPDAASQPLEQEAAEAETQAADETSTGFAKAPERLETFGHSIFNEVMATGSQALSGSVYPQYSIGPGDEIIISIWGAVEQNYKLEVDRSGEINIPQVGRLLLTGVILKDLEEKVRRRLSASYSGIRRDQSQSDTYVDVSLGKLRMIQVYVVGEVHKPGAYMVNSTITGLDALYQAGGPTLQGSLRNIALLRNEKKIAILDFYNFILKGQKGNNARLENQDVIHVPPPGKEVTLKGQLHRPAKYELRPDEGIRRLLEIAGGLVPESYAELVQIERIIEYRERLVLDLNLSQLLLSGEDFPLQDGDQIMISKIPDTYANAVAIEGYVKRPGIYQLPPGMTLKDLISKSGDIFPEAYLGRANLVRTHPDLTKELIPLHLGKALQGDPAHNLTLEPLDKITVYSIHTFGDDKFVTIDGLVRQPGHFALLEGMYLQDLIVLAGGLQEAAHKLKAEIARTDPSTATFKRPVQLFEATISDIYEIGPARPDDFALQNRDAVFIRPNPDFELQQYVTIQGQVHFPGRYALASRSERLTDLIQRAGNFKENAYFEGFRFSRGNQSIGINLKDALQNPGGTEDLILQSGDRINIPQKPATVEVKGAVYLPRTLLFRPHEGVDQYLERSGGLSKNADRGGTYFILPNGEILRPRRFLFWRLWPKMIPGIQIIVPTKGQIGPGKTTATQSYMKGQLKPRK